MGPKQKPKFLLASFGDPGHAFPLIALGKELCSRGYEVTLETWTNWKERVEAEGMIFAPAPEYQLFPTPDRPLKPYQAAVKATATTQALIRELKPDVVVSDVITLAPALAAELEGLPWVTVAPHLLPYNNSSMPPHGMGFPPPRTALGKRFWKAASRISEKGVLIGLDELNGTRSRLGLEPLDEPYGSMSRLLTLAATFPQLEYPREWPEWAKVSGPLLWEPPAPSVETPHDGRPLIVIAPSTSQDRKSSLLRASLMALGKMEVNVLATASNLEVNVDVPSNATLVDWLPYSQVIPQADLVICHAGHGTLARALSDGVPVLAVPAAGDMPENAIRLQWSGAGLALNKSLVGSRSLRWATEELIGNPSYRDKAQEFKAWSTENQGPQNAADLVIDKTINWC